MLFATLLFVFVFLSWIFEIFFDKKAGRAFSFSKEMTLPTRGILAILIILSHLSGKVDMPNVSDFGPPVVSIFFFLSGYGMCKSYLKRKQLYLQNFIRTRFSKLLPLYLIGVIFMTFVSINSAIDSGIGIGGVYH